MHIIDFQGLAVTTAVPQNSDTLEERVSAMSAKLLTKFGAKSVIVLVQSDETDDGTDLWIGFTAKEKPTKRDRIVLRKAIKKIPAKLKL